MAFPNELGRIVTLGLLLALGVGACAAPVKANDLQLRRNGTSGRTSSGDDDQEEEEQSAGDEDVARQSSPPTSNATDAGAAATVPPALTAVTPASIPAGTASVTLQLTGTGLQVGDLLDVNGTKFTMNVVSATDATVLLLADKLQSAATLLLTVSRGSTTSNALSFAVTQAPNATLTAISPTSANQQNGGNGLTLTATGSGFTSSSVVNFNGVDLATSYGGPTSVTAQVPASSLQVAGRFNVVVRTNGNLTTPLSFEVRAVNNTGGGGTQEGIPCGTAGVGGYGCVANGTSYQGMLCSDGILWCSSSCRNTYGTGSTTAQLCNVNTGGGTTGGSCSAQATRSACLSTPNGAGTSCGWIEPSGPCIR